MVIHCWLWVVNFDFYRGRCHHTLKRECALFDNVLTTYTDEATLANFRVSHQPTHLGIRTHTHKRLQINCKSHHYTLCELQALPQCQIGCLPSDVCGCLSPCASVTSTNTCLISNTSVHSPLIQTVLICTPCIADSMSTEFVMSLFMLVIQSRARHAISFQVDRTVLPFPSFCKS